MNKKSNVASILLVIIIIAFIVILILSITKKPTEEEETIEIQNKTFNLIIKNQEKQLLKANYEIILNGTIIKTGITSNNPNVYERIIQLSENKYKVFAYKEDYYPKYKECDIGVNCIITLKEKAITPYIYYTNKRLTITSKSGKINTPLICYNWGYGFINIEMDLKTAEIPNRNWYEKEEGFTPFKCYYLKTTKENLTKEEYNELDRETDKDCELITYKISKDNYAQLICHQSLEKNETVYINLFETFDGKEREPLSVIIIDKQYNELKDYGYSQDNAKYGIYDPIQSIKT